MAIIVGVPHISQEIQYFDLIGFPTSIEDESMNWSIELKSQILETILDFSYKRIAAIHL